MQARESNNLQKLLEKDIEINQENTITSNDRLTSIIDTSSINNGLKKAIRNNTLDQSYSFHISNEARAYAEHIHTLLSGIPDVYFDKNSDIFSQLRSGWILGNVFYCLKNGCIDLKRIIRTEDDYKKRSEYMAKNGNSDLESNENKNFNRGKNNENSAISNYETHQGTLMNQKNAEKEFFETINDSDISLGRFPNISFSKKSLKNTEKKRVIYEIHSNLVYVLSVASNLGIKLINIGAEDILHSNKVLVLGLLWQIVKYSLTRSSNVLRRPELITLKEENESVGDLHMKTPEELCLRWINYHLEMAHKEKYIERLRNINICEDVDYERREGEIENINEIFRNCYNKQENEGYINNRKSTLDNKIYDSYSINEINSKNKYKKNSKNMSKYLDFNEQQNRSDFFDNIPLRCRNFTNDIKDSKIYLILLKQIAPEKIQVKDIIKAWTEENLEKRAGHVLELADKLDCKKFVSATDICEGEHRLNFLFAQTLMNRYLGIRNSEEVMKKMTDMIFEYENSINILYEKVKSLSKNIISEKFIKTKKNSNKNTESEIQKNVILEQKKLSEKPNDFRNEFNEEFQKKLEDKSDEYKCLIKDMKASMDGFSYKIENYVEETIGISLPKTERCDSKERLWVLITKLMAEIKLLENEKKVAVDNLERRKKIDRMIENKLHEYISIQNKKEAQLKAQKSGVCNIFGCFNDDKN